MVNLTFPKIRAWIASKLFGNLITVDNNKLLTSTAINTKSEVATMSPSTKPTAYKPVLSVDTAPQADFGESSSSTPPLSGRCMGGNAGLNSPRSSNFSTDQECKLHSVKLISPTQHQQDQPQYSDDHSAVLEFTEAYLQEAFDVKSTNDLLVDQNDKVETFDVKPMDDSLADQNDEFEANQPSSSSASPTEPRKWWKRNKSEPKTPTSGQFYENTSTAALITAINLSNPNQELVPIESTMNSSTQTLITPKVIPNIGITETVDNDGGNLVSPSIGRLMQIPRKKVGSGSSKLPQAIDNPLATAGSSLAGKDSSSKGKGKDKNIVEPEEKDSQPKIIEESFDVGQDRASKDIAKKKKTKRSKGKSAQVETTADSSQLVENSATDGKEKLTESNESSENKAQLERENFIASKVNEIREKTGTQIVWYTKGDTPCPHPKHPRVWNSKNLWCGGGHLGACAKCEAPCCVLSGLTEKLKTESLTETEKQSAHNMKAGISLWVSAGSDESTFMECTECHKHFCPECLSVCPICGDRMCHDCNSVEPWTPCELHGDY